MMKRITCIVSGRVQMVMYRDFTCRTARRLGIVGVVQNEEDGTVSVIAEGEEQKLTEFISELKKGSIFSSVEDVAVNWSDATSEFTNFQIVY